MSTARVVHGDCLEVLPTLAAESIDSVVCDPPYEISFMNRAWDGRGIAFDPATWAAVYRVLKPGAHLLAFGGTRTYHRMVCAIEDAGFEIRDSIHWVYGSGFPKSHDVGKGIDKAAGAKREVVGVNLNTQGRTTRSSGGLLNKVPCADMGNGTLTAPATPDAQTWDGWGTALKPAHEIICVARKPLSEKSVAANVLKHGTGALNIDACRINRASSDVAGWAESGAPRGGLNGTDTFSNHARAAEEIAETLARGRWPANFMLQHAEGCVCAGMRQVQSDGHHPAVRGQAGLWSGEGGGLNGNSGPERHMGDADGFETVEDWRCVDGCPVKMLDEQSGYSKSQPGVRRNQNLGWKCTSPPSDQFVEHDDSGTASRFFQQFPPFIYNAKPSRAERDKGCHSLAKQRAGVGCDRPSGDFGQRLKQDGRDAVQARNVHPTVKSVALLRYLVRLVTPYEGTVLDPFCGSGTTGMACLDEGFSFIGIEKEAEYVEIATVRVRSAVSLFSDFEAPAPPPAASLFGEGL